MKQKLCIIGSVWPEPNSSAAGSRMLQLIRLFLSENWELTFATATQDNPHRFPLEDLGVHVNTIVLNDVSFDEFIQDLNPSMVLFDRFMTEEQFGWRVAKHCPEAVRILDTEDLHCLRKARQKAHKEQREFVYDDLHTDVAFRELASIYRSDLTLMISTFEMELLENYFKIPSSLLCYVPFLLDAFKEDVISQLPTFEQRAHFCTIGSFRHEPNWDSVRFLHSEIWPLLRKKLPTAEMHVYGSYPPQKAMQLHNEKKGFLIKGWAEDAVEVLKNSRICLAPLRFGAGLKGKFIDAMTAGTPSITTEIGAEGMHDNLPWGGSVVNTVSEIVAAAEELYTNKEKWLLGQQRGFAIRKTFEKDALAKELLSKLYGIHKGIDAHRKSNFIGAMLSHHSMKSTEYMARWIEAKNN